MNAKEFRVELVKIMPGYSWTVHKPLNVFRKIEGLPPPPLVATGMQSSGSNRLSTLEVVRRENDGQVTYTARSSGYGLRAPWLHENKDDTLARALRGLQAHYEAAAATYRGHAEAMKHGRGLAHKADKQRARDACAAGMGDPLVTAAPAVVAGPVVNRATVIEWLDANDIEVTDRQMDGLFHFAAPTTQPSPAVQGVR